MTVVRDVEFWVGLRSCRYKVVVVVLASGCRLSDRYLQSLDLMTHIVAVRGCAWLCLRRGTWNTIYENHRCNTSASQDGAPLLQFDVFPGQSFVSRSSLSSGKLLKPITCLAQIHMSLIRYPRLLIIAHNPF